MSTPRELSSKVLKTLIFLFIVALGVIGCNNILKAKAADIKMADFYSEKQDFDILFFGSSHPQLAVQPMELWQKYGLISFNLSVPSEKLSTTYQSVRLAVAEHRPKLVVVDIYYNYAKPRNYDRERYHNTLDLYPLTPLKVQAVTELANNDQKSKLDDYNDFLLNFPFYHSRWNKLTKDDFKVTTNLLKGSSTSIRVAEPLDPIDYNSIPAEEDLSKIDISALQNIIDYCNENNISLLLTYDPHIADKNQIAAAKYLSTYIAERGIPYLNFLENPINNPYTDFMDSEGTSPRNSHLNLTGAKKFNAYLGQYLVDNFNLPDHRSDPAYAHWHEDYQEYLDYIKQVEEGKINAL